MFRGCCVYTDDDPEPINWFAVVGLIACFCWALTACWTAPPDRPPVTPPPVHSSTH